MNKLIAVPVFVLSLAGLFMSGQATANVSEELKARIASQCKAEAEGAVDPEILTQHCIEEKLQELSGEAEGKGKEES